MIFSACEKHFTSLNGTIQSSNYPNGSTQPFKCTYVINAEKTKAIRLKFNFIGLNTDIKTCFYDVAKHYLLEDYVEVSFLKNCMNLFENIYQGSNLSTDVKKVELKQRKMNRK